MVLATGARPIRIPLAGLGVRWHFGAIVKSVNWAKTRVAAPAPGTAGEWRSEASGQWHFMDGQHQVRGFALTGTQTARRAEQAKLVLA